MTQLFVLALMMFSIRSEACQEWGCTKASPAVKQCVGLTQRTLKYPDPMVSPISPAGSNCLKMEGMGPAAMDAYMLCIGGGGSVGKNNQGTFVANCYAQGMAAVRSSKVRSSPRRAITSYQECVVSVRQALMPPFPEATALKYLRNYGRPNEECDKLLSCIDQAYDTKNFTLALVDSCLSQPAGTSRGPTHPTSMQNSGAPQVTK